MSAGKNLCPKRREIHQVKKRMQQAQMVLSYAGFPQRIFCLLNRGQGSLFVFDVMAELINALLNIRNQLAHQLAASAIEAIYDFF